MTIDARMPLSIGEVARRSGVTVSTIHFYEAKGLIQAWRSKGNQRRYARDVLRRIAVIKVAQRAGIYQGRPTRRNPIGRHQGGVCRASALSSAETEGLAATLQELARHADRSDKGTHAAT